MGNEKHARRIRKLTQALVISFALNLGFISTFLLTSVRGDRSARASTQRSKSLNLSYVSATNEQLLRAYSRLSFAELQRLLADAELVEEGYTKRDLALGCLATFHHLNVEKALGGQLERRKIALGGAGAVEVELFPGLTDEHFQAALHFAKTETWPLTAEGLFHEVVRSRGSYEPSLVEAFSHTREYFAAKNILERARLSPSAQELLNILASGSWELIHGFASTQREHPNRTIEYQRAFLLDYLEAGSPLAASWLLQLDADFALKRLSDEQVIKLLETVEPTSYALEPFAKALLMSARSDSVYHHAAEKLYALHGEALPRPYDHRRALLRFGCAHEEEIVPVTYVADPTPETHSVQTKEYVVQSGDSLWKIAHRHHVDMDTLIEINGLQEMTIHPGDTLLIP